MYSSWNAAPREPATARHQAEAAARFYTDQLAGGEIGQAAADALAATLAQLIERRLLESPKFKLTLAAGQREGAGGLLSDLLCEVLQQPAHRAIPRAAFAQLAGQLVIDDRTVEAYEPSAPEPRRIFGGSERPLLDPPNSRRNGPDATGPGPEVSGFAL